MLGSFWTVATRLEAHSTRAYQEPCFSLFSHSYSTGDRDMASKAYDNPQDMTRCLLSCHSTLQAEEGRHLRSLWPLFLGSFRTGPTRCVSLRSTSHVHLADTSSLPAYLNLYT